MGTRLGQHRQTASRHSIECAGIWGDLLWGISSTGGRNTRIGEEIPYQTPENPVGIDITTGFLPTNKQLIHTYRIGVVPALSKLGAAMASMCSAAKAVYRSSPERLQYRFKSDDCMIAFWSLPAPSAADTHLVVICRLARSECLCARALPLNAPGRFEFLLDAAFAAALPSRLFTDGRLRAPHHLLTRWAIDRGVEVLRMSGVTAEPSVFRCLLSLSPVVAFARRQALEQEATNSEFECWRLAFNNEEREGGAPGV